MKKISFVRLCVQLCWLALIILSFVSERVSYFRTTILLGTILLGPIGFMSISWTQFFSFFTNIFSQIL